MGKDLSGPDRTVQQATVNLLADMGVQPQCLGSGLVRAEPPSPWNGAPSSTVHQAVVADGRLQVSGTAEAHEVVAGVEVCLDDEGVRWHPVSSMEHAEGEADTCMWNYEVPWNQAGPPKRVLSRAVDDRGLVEGRDWTEQDAERAMWEKKGRIGC